MGVAPLLPYCCPYPCPYCTVEREPWGLRGRAPGTRLRSNARLARQTRRCVSACRARSPPPPPPPNPVLIGHAASFTPY